MLNRASSIYLNCGSQNNLVEPYVGVGIHVRLDHLDKIGQLLSGFPSQVRNLSPHYEREVLEALYRVYCIFESRDEDQHILGDFILVRSNEVNKYGHHVACAKTVRSLSIRMKALCGEDSYCFISDGSMGKECRSVTFRLAAIYSRYIRSFFVSSYKHWFPNLSVAYPVPETRPLPSYYIDELIRRSAE